MALTRYVFGVPRSGSTLAYNLVRLLSEDECAHTHSFVPPSETKLPMVCTFRDFRDCAVSQWIRKESHGKKSVTYDELLPWLDFTREYIAYLNSYRQDERWQPDWIFFARYKDWVEDFPYRFAQEIRNRLDLKVSNSRLWRIVKECSLHAMRRRAELHDSPDFKLGHDHIDDGAVGKWRRYVVIGDQQRVTDYLAGPLEYWGFEL